MGRLLALALRLTLFRLFRYAARRREPVPEPRRERRRRSAFLPRLVSLTLIWLLGSSALTFAVAGERLGGAAATPPTARHEAVRPELVVPDVRRQPYVFAKGILEDAGLGWRVEGSVHGYAANIVVTQTPAPGTRVVDTGAPAVVLGLERNPEYSEQGLPEDGSPYATTALVLAAAPAAPKPRRTPPARKRKDAPAALVERARLLERRLTGFERSTSTVVSWWLWEHGRIVAAARDGAKGGPEALRILVRADLSLQRRWGIGAKSAALARAALPRT